jgi:hypothetical protein
VRELLPGGGIAYSAFVDPSGGSDNGFTLAVGHLEGDGIAVLDAIREVRPPFSPDAAVEEFATLMKSYGIARVHGDFYGGEWPGERFAAHGISYEVSKRPKSAIYLEFLPALNARRVRLLDNPRLISQLVTLERKTARGGKDTIAPEADAHDDIANSVAGCLVQVIEDRRPTLIRAGGMYDHGDAAIPLPPAASIVYATFAVGRDGTAAAVFFAAGFSYNDPNIPHLTLCDYTVAPLSSTTIDALWDRLIELATAIRVRRHTVTVYVPEILQQQIQQRGYPADVIPKKVLADPDGAALLAAGHINNGLVKIATPAAERSRTSPLRGVLAYRAGEKPDDNPLRWATLLGIGIGLTPQ